MSNVEVHFKFGKLFVDSKWISNAKCKYCKKDIQIVRLPNNSKIAIDKDKDCDYLTYHSKDCKDKLMRKKYAKVDKKLICEHGRLSGIPCPHCLGLNNVKK